MENRPGQVRKILFVLRNSKRRLPLLTLYFIMSSLLDVLGLALILPFVSIVSDSEKFQESGFFVWVTSMFGSVELQSLINILGGLLVFIFLAKVLTSTWLNYRIYQFSFFETANLRKSLMLAFMGIDYSSYAQRNSSEYIYSVQTLTANFQSALVAILKIASESLVAAVIMVYLISTSGTIVVYLVGFLFFFAWLYIGFIRNKIIGYGEIANIASTEMIKTLREGILGLKEIRVLKKQKHFYDGVSHNADVYAEASVKNQVFSLLPRSLLEFGLVFFLIALIWIVQNRGESISDYFAILSMLAVAAIRLVPSLNNIISSILVVKHCHHSIDLLYDDIAKYVDKSKISDGDRARDVERIQSFNSLELKNIGFSYPGTQVAALSGVNIRIQRGEAIGIVGPSGAGKSTLVDIMLGLLKPESGELLFNDRLVDPKHEEEWTSHMAYLPQEAFLVDDSLANNVALGERRDDINISSLMRSLEQARLIAFVEQLESGFDSRIGESGIMVSGGQKQRISLARAFYFSKDVILLDEPTSALDEDTEIEITNEILALKGEKTLVIISHRPSLLTICDRIYKLGVSKNLELLR